MYGFYYDPTYIMVLIGVVICMLASANINRTFQKYSRIRSHSGMTGREAAERLLHANGIYDVTVQHVAGNLTDHYDPRNKTLNLSDSTYASTSVAAIGVAAHECGHAVQHANGYAPLKIRGSLVPVANFGSTLAWPLILIGFLIQGNASVLLINLGILLFSAAVLFQIVTLPVEFNASSRALKSLETNGILYTEEVADTRKVLRAAALTYVASAASAILQLLRLILISGGEDEMTKAINEREIVLEVLLEITEHGMYSHIVLRDVLNKYQYLEKKERSFITRVTEGTLEHMMEIDYILDQFSKVKVKKMKPVIRNIMRSAVYQMKYMDSVPVSAACNEAVKLAARKGFGSLRGFVNGVLRNVARNLDQIAYPTEPLKRLSIQYSMPEWILNLWLKAYDSDIVEQMLQAFQRETPLTIRCNLRMVTPKQLKEHLEAEGVTVKVHPYLEYAFHISGFDYLGDLESFQNGEFFSTRYQFHACK